MNLDQEKLSLKEIAKRLDVKYILNGSISSSENNYNLKCNLREAATGISIYLKKWTEKEENLPKIVSNISQDIIENLKLKTIQNQRSTINTDHDAYELYLRGKFIYQEKKTEQDIAVAKGLYAESIYLDSNLVLSYLQLGDLFYDNQEYDKAEEVYQKGYKISKDNKDERLVAYTLKSLSRVYIHHRDYDNFHQSNKQVTIIFNKINDKKGIAENFEIVGDMYENRYDYEKSRVNYQKSKEIYEELGYKRNIANIIVKLAEVIDESHYKKTELKKIQLYEQALQLFRYLDDKLGIANTLSLLGTKIYGWSSEINDEELYSKITYLSEALEIYKELQDINNLIRYHSAISHSYAEIGNLDQALLHMQTSIE